MECNQGILPSRFVSFIFDNICNKLSPPSLPTPLFVTHYRIKCERSAFLNTD